ncbi:hypothetical protein [Micromonospora tarensis]|nr:hypothetical protein [Micromonospora tarensis]
MRTWRRALAILDDLGHPGGERVRGLLAGSGRRPGDAGHTGGG